MIARRIIEMFSMGVGELSDVATDVRTPDGTAIHSTAVRFTEPLPSGAESYIFVLEDDTALTLATAIGKRLPAEMRSRLVADLMGGIELPGGHLL